MFGNHPKCLAYESPAGFTVRMSGDRTGNAISNCFLRRIAFMGGQTVCANCWEQTTICDPVRSRRRLAPERRPDGNALRFPLPRRTPPTPKDHAADFSARRSGRLRSTTVGRRGQKGPLSGGNGATAARLPRSAKSPGTQTSSGLTAIRVRMRKRKPGSFVKTAISEA